ncbi:MAG: bifunctional folylpolyglutamate synthase/dihydrofolate synthase [Desulfuromonas sp.]|nr:bifunctional folylpolyglutamate synthase/dihydrofolate synthase [Desulfuromonas sp.]
MTPAQTLEFLYGLQMFGIKLGLDNIRALLQSAGNPQEDYGIIHVAGTNGKGSVCAYLQQIYHEAGYRVGVYTSPHLHRFNERISINSQQITDEALVALVEELRENNLEVPATFFEFTTALALLYFSRQQVDLVVLEVGMGGRLDATNVVQPLVSVITPVSDDHGDYLGTTLVEIAAEKGGIIKPGVPVVIGKQDEEALTVLQQIVTEQQAPAFLYGDDYVVDYVLNGVAGSYRVMTPECSWAPLTPGLPGDHQSQNMSSALMVVDCLQSKGFPVAGEVVYSAVADTRWPGRLEWWPDSLVPVLLDGAHNVAGATALAAYLADQKISKIRWVAGFKADKDMAAVVTVLLPVLTRVYCVAPPVEAAYPPAYVVTFLNTNGVVACRYDAVATALAAALDECEEDEVVVVAGSLFLVAACREWLLTNE